MEQTVNLTKKEYEYLMHSLLKEREDLRSKIKHSDAAATGEGWILEHFIDKFYFDEE